MKSPLQEACLRLWIAVLDEEPAKEDELQLALMRGGAMRGPIEHVRDYASTLTARTAAAELLAIVDAKASEAQEFIQQELDAMVDRETEVLKKMTGLVEKLAPLPPRKN